MPLQEPDVRSALGSKVSRNSRQRKGNEKRTTGDDLTRRAGGRGKVTKVGLLTRCRSEVGCMRRRAEAAGEGDTWGRALDTSDYPV